MVIVTTLLATETALSLVFDARWQDFPYASLTMAVPAVVFETVMNDLRFLGVEVLAESAAGEDVVFDTDNGPFTAVQDVNLQIESGESNFADLAKRAANAA